MSQAIYADDCSDGSLPGYQFDVEFCRPVLPRNQILCLHHFSLRSLYFQSLQSLTKLIQLYM